MYYAQREMRPTAATIRRMRCSGREQIHSTRPGLLKLAAIFATGSLVTYAAVKLAAFAMYFFIFGHMPSGWVV